MRRLETVMYDPCDPRAARVERRHADRAYSLAWLSSAFNDTPVFPKVGLAAVLAVFVDGYHLFFTRVFAAALVLWFIDMVIGMARALSDPTVRFRWPKMIDGVLRLLVMGAVALGLAVLEEAIGELGGVKITGKLLSVAYGVFIVAEGVSIITNASYFWPGLAGLTAKLITILPSGEPQVEDATLVVKLKERTPAEEDL